MRKYWIYPVSVAVVFLVVGAGAQTIRSVRAKGSSGAGLTFPDRSTARVWRLLQLDPPILQATLDPFAAFLSLDWTLPVDSRPHRTDQGKEVEYTFLTEGHSLAQLNVKADKREIVMEASERSEAKANSRMPAAQTQIGPQAVKGFGERWDSKVSISTPVDVDPTHFRIQKQKDGFTVIFEKRSQLHSQRPKAPGSLFEGRSRYLKNEEVDIG